MSDHAHSHGSHGHASAPDHIPHVTPLWVYLATWGALVFLTAITVGASYVNFGPANLVIAIIIATIKAAVVGALFMHLLHDQRYHTLILLSGGLFLMIFVAFTMFDTEFRGRADKIEAERPANVTRPFEGTAAQKEMKAKWLGGQPASSAPAVPPGGAPATLSVPALIAAPPVPAAAAPAVSASAAPAVSAAASGSAAPPASAAPSAAAPTPATSAPAAH